MRKKRVGILFGGRSGEHEVSLVSAASVYTHIDTSRFEPILIGIDYDGRWYLQNGPYDGAEKEPQLDEDGKQLVLNKADSMSVSVEPGLGLSVNGKNLGLEIVFPVLHGTFGEDGTVQGLLEIANTPYVGAGVLGSAVGMDKAIMKRVWMHDGLPTIPFVQAEVLEFRTKDGMDLIETRTLQKFSYPLFVKPARSGSSVGVTRAEDRAHLEAALETAFRFDTKVLIEPEISGREVECSVVGNEQPVPFAVGEIVPSHDFYDYEAKYIDPDGAELRIPAPLDTATNEEVRRLAVEAYRAVDAEGFSRIDFFIDTEGKVLLNEINTIPGFTHISMFPKLCEYDGLAYSDLIERLISLGLERFERRNSLHYMRT
ncbi:MAG: D-alanine--D-alanine ligase family protein [Sediminispirochaetaceae bacterium]